VGMGMASGVDWLEMEEVFEIMNENFIFKCYQFDIYLFLMMFY
jgi:hypothetical protein